MYKLIYNNIWKKYILSNKRKEASRVSIYKCNYLETVTAWLFTYQDVGCKGKETGHWLWIPNADRICYELFDHPTRIINFEISSLFKYSFNIFNDGKEKFY